jgi:ribosome-associated protein
MTEFKSTVQEGYDEVSKSHIKRNMLALQDISKLLMNMKASVWDEYQLNKSMVLALEESKRIKLANALNRHIRRLARLLSEHDEGFIQALSEKIKNKDVDNLRHSMRLERWRDHLIEGDKNTFSKISDMCVNVDQQHLRQLIRNAQKEKDIVKLSMLKSKIFKYLKSLRCELA